MIARSATFNKNIVIIKNSLLKKEVFSKLNDIKAENVVIISHENPDGDAVGSMIALQWFLSMMGKECAMWLPEPFPDYYSWLKGSSKIRIYCDANRSALVEDLKNAEALYFVDLAAISRTGGMGSLLKKFSGDKILIDHHQVPKTDDFSLVISDASVSSTAELIYWIMDHYALVKKIPVSVAEALYVGLITDTGSFSYNCNNSLPYEMAAGLMRTGINPTRINQLVYSQNSEARLKLIGYALYNNLTVLKQYRTAFISLSEEEMRMFSQSPGDTEGLVNYALSVKGVEMAALFTLRGGEVRISFRSKSSFPVNIFAKNHFDGGGHKNAAGGRWKGSINDAVAHFLALLPQLEKEINGVE
jgi:phosphoesterase RecJ-like protein